MDEIEQLTRQLVQTPSHDDETELGIQIEQWLLNHTNADVRRDDAPNGGNIIATKGNGSPTLAFVGHHDVVPPASRQQHHKEYVVKRRGDRLYGRGTADMTGALAAAMIGFRNADPDTSIQFTSFVGEERGGIGAKHAIDSGYQPEYAIIGEGSAEYETPAGIDIVIAHRGRRELSIITTGTRTHASVPETGANAIYRAADAIQDIRNIDPPRITMCGKTLSGSIAATMISGGTASNTIPDSCTITVDERTAPEQLTDLQSIIRSDNIEIQCEQHLPAMRCDDPAFAEFMQDTAVKSQTTDSKLVTKPHTTDAGRLNQAGTTCVVCGPAEQGEAHTDTESVSLSALHQCRRIYQRAFENFGSWTSDNSSLSDV